MIDEMVFVLIQTTNARSGNYWTARSRKSKIKDGFQRSRNWIHRSCCPFIPTLFFFGLDQYQNHFIDHTQPKDVQKWGYFGQLKTARSIKTKKWWTRQGSCIFRNWFHRSCSALTAFLNDTANDTVKEILKEILKQTLKKTLETSIKENPKANLKGNPKGKRTGNRKGNPKGKRKGNRKGNPEGNPNENPTRNRKGKPKGNPKRNPKGNPKGNLKGNPKNNRKGKPKRKSSRKSLRISLNKNPKQKS
jgi:hypothetical protein